MRRGSGSCEYHARDSYESDNSHDSYQPHDCYEPDDSYQLCAAYPNEFFEANESHERDELGGAGQCRVTSPHTKGCT